MQITIRSPHSRDKSDFAIAVGVDFTKASEFTVQPGTASFIMQIFFLHRKAKYRDSTEEYLRTRGMCTVIWRNVAFNSISCSTRAYLWSIVSKPDISRMLIDFFEI